MATDAPLIMNDWRRVQRLLREHRERLVFLTRQGPGGADAASIEATLHHIDGLKELGDAVKARLMASGVRLTDDLHFHRHDYSILVVDDHETTRYGISRALRASGYHILEARAGAEALELSKFASALVLDVQLPDVHGFEVCRLVRHESRTHDMPIIHISAVHRTYADREASRCAGADDFLTAPIELKRLTGMLDELLLDRAAGAL